MGPGVRDERSSRIDIRLMDKILHDPKDPNLRELWYIPYYGSCRILSINRTIKHEGNRETCFLSVEVLVNDSFAPLPRYGLLGDGVNLPKARRVETRALQVCVV